VQSQYHHRRSTVTGLSVYVAVLVATLAWFLFYQFPSTTVDGPRRSAANADLADQYAGSIIIPLGATSMCRQMTFDNNTGAFYNNGVVKCRDDAPSANSTEGRMNAIKNAFTKK